MGYVPVVADGYYVLAKIVRAVSGTPRVRVVLFCFQTVVPDVIVCVIRKSTSTALILPFIRAIDHLLHA